MEDKIRCDECFHRENQIYQKRYEERHKEELEQIEKLRSSGEYSGISLYEKTFSRRSDIAQYQNIIAKQYSYLYSMLMAKETRCKMFTLCNNCAAKMYYEQLSEIEDNNVINTVLQQNREVTVDVVLKTKDSSPSPVSPNDYQSSFPKREGRSFTDEMSTVSYIAGVTDWNGNYTNSGGE